MIKWTETVTRKEGQPETTVKEFPTAWHYRKAISTMPLPGWLRYELKRKKEITIQYDDALVHIEISGEEPGPIILTGEKAHE